MMRAPKDCETMEELRAGIDRLDADLVRLLAERAAHIDRAAEIKRHECLPARIETRIHEVLENVRRHAVQHGLSLELAETVWRDLIEWSIAREEACLGSELTRED